MVLSRALILEAADLRTESVDVPEWGGEVLLRELSAAQMSEFKAKSVAAVDPQTRAVRDGVTLFGLSAWIVSRSAIGEDGKRLFTDADLPRLGEKSDKVIDRLAARVLEMSGAATTVEETEKN